nr:protein FAR1-RELATED SEQUENCE 5-like [Ipomoea batatas]
MAFKDARFGRIPGQYILQRWTRKTCRHRTLVYANSELDSTAEIENGKSEMATVFDEFFKCVGQAYGNNKRVSALAQVLQEHRENSTGDLLASEPRTVKEDIIRSFCGTTSSPNIVVHPPTISNNKGSGKRFKSSKELALEQAAKGERKCWTCKKYGHHDSRNCELRPKTKKRKSDSVSE